MRTSRVLEHSTIPYLTNLLSRRWSSCTSSRTGTFTAMLTVVSPGKPGNGKPTDIVPPAMLSFVVAIASAGCGREENPRSLERGLVLVVWSCQDDAATAVPRRRRSGYEAVTPHRWVLIEAPSCNNWWIAKADRRMAAVDGNLEEITVVATTLGKCVGRGVVLRCRCSTACDAWGCPSKKHRTTDRQ